MNITSYKIYTNGQGSAKPLERDQNVLLTWLVPQSNHTNIARNIQPYNTNCALLNSVLNSNENGYHTLTMSMSCDTTLHQTTFCMKIVLYEMWIHSKENLDMYLWEVHGKLGPNDKMQIISLTPEGPDQFLAEIAFKVPVVIYLTEHVSFPL